jgi:hypothetical protein
MARSVHGCEIQMVQKILEELRTELAKLYSSELYS